MNERSAALTVGVALALVCVAWAAIPGPNDLRYPDYIVDPRVTCPKEGSFPHPRNCSWYYRCVDRMEIGYFWTYFFECEPGTVFADELDQCVHPYLAAPPCGSPPKTPKPTPTPTPTTTLTPVLCTGVDGTCKQYDICRPQRAKKTFCAEIRCNLRTSNLRCPAGKLFDMSTEQCTFPPKESDLCKSFECVGVPDTCTTYKVCRPKVYERVLCGKMLCSGHSTPLECSPGKAFDIAIKQCIAPPSESDLCKSFECVGVPDTCTTYKVCRPKVSERVLCGKMLCSGHSTPLVCSPGKAFDIATRQCIAPPSESDLCTGFKNINVSEQGQLKCSYDNLYPQSEFTSRLNCETYALCDAGIYQGQKELCRTYYECYRAEGKWQVRPLSCVAGLLYSHQEGKCVVPPTAAELCRA